MAGFDWDEAVEVEDDSYKILEPGEHDFVVTKFERKWHEGSAKIEPCNMAVYTLDFDGVKIDYRLWLLPSYNWRTAQFFKSIGLIDPDTKAGTSVVFPWEKALYCRGRAQTGTHEYNGNVYNDVKKCIVPKKTAPADYGTF